MRVNCRKWELYCPSFVFSRFASIVSCSSGRPARPNDVHMFGDTSYAETNVPETPFVPRNYNSIAETPLSADQNDDEHRIKHANRLGEVLFDTLV